MSSALILQLFYLIIINALKFGLLYLLHPPPIPSFSFIPFCLFLIFFIWCSFICVWALVPLDLKSLTFSWHLPLFFLLVFILISLSFFSSPLSKEIRRTCDGILTLSGSIWFLYLPLNRLTHTQKYLRTHWGCTHTNSLTHAHKLKHTCHTCSNSCHTLGCPVNAVIFPSLAALIPVRKSVCYPRLCVCFLCN